MGNGRGRRTVRWLVTVCMLVAVAGLVTSARARSQATKQVTYHGYKVEVPTSWPVVDLARNPSACVRFDVHAVYLGHPGADPSCPAKLVGRTEALLVEPIDRTSKARVGADTIWAPPGMAAVARVPARASHEVTVGVSQAGVLVTGSYGDDRGTLEEVVSGATLTQDAQPAPELAPTVSTATSVVVPGTFTGTGFDACTAPSSATMQAWLASSPYRAIGVYIGGASRSCAQPNLTASWVSEQTTAGWKLIPIYVGLQAPCGGLANKIDPATAGAQGRAAADDAVSSGGALGIGAGSAIYFDMEAYPTTDTACRQAVLTFLSGWSTRLHELSYLSGAYSSASSGIRDLVSVYDTTALQARPDYVWFARWDGVATVSDPVIPDADWANHQRIKQYQGLHDEPWGGATINIDTDYLDVAAAQLPPPPPAGDDQDGPAVAALGSEIHVFARGVDKRLYEAVFKTTSGWSNWAPRGTLTIQGSPSVIRYSTGINLFARGTDGRLYETYLRSGSGWSTWKVHTGATLAGDPTALLYGTDIHIFARTTTNVMAEIYYRSGWKPWTLHTGVSIAGTPAAVVYGTSGINVYARGTNNHLYETYYRSGTGWASWRVRGGTAVAMA